MILTCFVIILYCIKSFLKTILRKTISQTLEETRCSVVTKTCTLPSEYMQLSREYRNGGANTTSHSFLGKMAAKRFEVGIGAD